MVTLPCNKQLIMTAGTSVKTTIRRNTVKQTSEKQIPPRVLLHTSRSTIFGQHTHHHQYVHPIPSSSLADEYCQFYRVIGSASKPWKRRLTLTKITLYGSVTIVTPQTPPGAVQLIYTSLQ